MSEYDAKITKETAVIYQQARGGIYGMGRWYWFAWWIGNTFGPLLMAITNAKAIHFGEQRLGRRRTLIRVEWK